jgi:hypothetical protein
MHKELCSFGIACCCKPLLKFQIEKACAALEAQEQPPAIPDMHLRCLATAVLTLTVMIVIITCT